MTSHLSDPALAASLLRELFPLCRSITGPGVRETLRVLQRYVNLTIHEVPTGTRCFDWTVPDEWTIRDAFIADEDGRRIVDFRESNLHVVNYSVPVDAVMSYGELHAHLNTLPEHPDAIPYRTSYYTRTWGFCLSERTKRAMDPNGRYRVVIDSSLAPGSLTIGETVLGSGCESRYIASTYCCHPSLANDNLSGIVLTTLLLRRMQQRSLSTTWHFVLAPETIGMLAYLNMRSSEMATTRGGFVITCAAGPGSFVRKQSFEGNAMIDRATRVALRDLDQPATELPFDPQGSDERQLSSPAFRIPTTTVSRSMYYQYPEYHTDQDNLGFVSAERLVSTLEVYDTAARILDRNRYFTSTNPHGEPQLGRRGLYPTQGGAIRQVGAAQPQSSADLDVILWLLFYGDGRHSYIDLAETLATPYFDIVRTADTLVRNGLIREHSEPCG